MDELDERRDARSARGCRCCGTLFITVLLLVGALVWLDYSKAQRLARELDTQELESTQEIEQFLAEQDIKLKREEGEWKADAPWKQPLVDRLRERFDTLARDERVEDARLRAEESAQYIRELLAGTPQELAPYLEDIKQRLAYLTDRETLREAIEELGQLDSEWLEQEAGRLLDSAPGENIELYIEKLQAMFDNVRDEDLRGRLRKAIEQQTGRLHQQSELGELPEIDPETSELPLVLEYMQSHDDEREPADWGFVREVDFGDGMAYNVEVTFTDGSLSSYYIQDGAVVFVATSTAGQMQ